MIYNFPYFEKEITGEGVVYDNFTLYFESRKYGVPVEADNLEDAIKEIEQWAI